MKLETQLLSLSERLQDAVNVCYTAPQNEDHGYPYKLVILNLQCKVLLKI